MANIRTFYLEGYGEVLIYPLPFYMKPFAIACTINKKIHYSCDKFSATTVRHELVHVLQQKELGWFRFLCLYVYLWIRAGFSYRKHPMELDAKEWSFNKNFVDKRPCKNWNKYK